MAVFRFSEGELKHRICTNPTTSVSGKTEVFEDLSVLAFFGTLLC